MSEELLTCPVCLTPNFTKRGLKAHKCKGGNRLNKETGLVEVVPPLVADPWDRPRKILDGIKLCVRMSLAGQVLLGHELSVLKKDMGFVRGNNQHGRIGQNVQSSKTWAELIEENLKISYKTADRMIECFEAAKARLKKLGHLKNIPSGSKKLELLFTARPDSMTGDDRDALAKCVDKLVDGDTQKDLLQELKITKFNVPLKGGDTSMHRKPNGEEHNLGQLTFAFFSPLADSLRDICTHPDRDAFFVCLATDEPARLHEMEISLESTLEAIRAAKAKRVKGNLPPA